MMITKKNKESAKSVYLFLSSKKRKILVKSLILAGLLLGINAYAWFIYVDKFGGSINATVISWDVTFFEDDDQINTVSLNIDSLYPGMIKYEKQIIVENKSDLEAEFKYSVESINLFGIEYKANNQNESDMILQELESGLPFAISFVSSAVDLPEKNGRATFDISANWDFEHQSPYYKLNKFNEFNKDTKYYSLNNGVYTLDDTVTIENYLARLATGLYIDSDEADTYWGHKAAIYKNNNPASPCLILNLKLVVSQKQ